MSLPAQWRAVLGRISTMSSGSLFYRKTAGTGIPEVQTLATLKTDLGLFGTNTGDSIDSDGFESFTKVGTTNFEAWHWAGMITGVAMGTKVVVANTAYAIPFIGPRRTGAALDRIAINATAAAGNVQLAMYTEANGIPDQLKTDFGSVAASGISSITISRTATAGVRYFLCAVFDSTPTVRAPSTNAAHVLGASNLLDGTSNTHITATLTFGAWPGTFPTTGMAAATGNPPGIAVRFSS